MKKRKTIETLKRNNLTLIETSNELIKESKELIELLSRRKDFAILTVIKDGETIKEKHVRCLKAGLQYSFEFDKLIRFEYKDYFKVLIETKNFIITLLEGDDYGSVEIHPQIFNVKLDDKIKIKGADKMKNRIRFQCLETIEKEKIRVEQGIYNGFGKLINLPPKEEIISHERNFDANELGDFFIEMGESLKMEKSQIKNMSIDYALINNPSNRGKIFSVVFSYEIVTKSKNKN